MKKFYLLPLPIIVMLLLACCGSSVVAQHLDTLNTEYYSSFRHKTIATQQRDSILIDSLSIAEGSLILNGYDTSNYTLLPSRALIVWKTHQIPDSITLSYRVLPFNFHQHFAHKSGKEVDSNYAFPIYVYSENDSVLKSGFVDFNSVEYAGSYGRSLSIGNNQDVSLNSNFNLQLNGYILDSVRVEAALTDNNIPFQPDGNTQQIQEFDRLYITFEKGNHKLTAGDYNLERPNSYFVNFNKRVQGLFYEGTYPSNKKIKNKIGLSGSIAKGEFARNILQGIEGNQGPYKLTGNNGEQFFIVLAGSEKVYIDGLLMERGEDRDYIINYNTGEVNFMPRKMITKDSRIQIEFEYQDRNYLNSLIYVYDELQIGDKWNINFNAYSNQDAKNQNYLQNLSGEQKRYLQGIGDSIDNAYYRNVTEDTFAANKILYKIIDSTVNGFLYDSVFVYSTNIDSAKYNVGFSYVGAGKGDYTISDYNSNGRSYTWVAPINGMHQGDYAPISVLITPKKQQLFTIGTSYKIDSLKQVSVELSASNYDPNLFSSIDNNNHWGFAGRAAYKEQRFFGKKDSTGKQLIRWQNNLSYEYVQGKYKAIAPFRNVEFNRDWNVDSAQALHPQDEQLVNYSTQLEKMNVGKITYDLTYYKRGSDFNANRNIVSLLYDRKGIRGGAAFDLMHSENDSIQSNYYRPNAFIEKDFKKILNLTLGAKYQLEHNMLQEKHTDSLALSSFSFDVLSFYLKSPEENKIKVDAAYTTRSDKSPVYGEFADVSRSHNFETTIRLTQWKNHQLSFTGSYRKLMVYDSAHSLEAPGETVLGRVEYSGNIMKGFLQPTLLYEVGSGQQQKQQFTYVEVPAGQGVYFWNDYNGDGVQQGNEFEIALYPDQKKYIRVITPTNDYVKANYVNFNFALQVSPENLWGKDAGKFGKFLSRFSDQLSAQVNNKTLAVEGFKAFNPFSNGFNDTDIIANSASVSNTLYFNRSSSVWGVDYTFQNNSGKNLLTYGLEANNQMRHLLKSRWAFNKAFTANLQAQSGKRAYDSGVPDDGRTYNVLTNSAAPSLTWIMKSKLRITAEYTYDHRQNTLSDTGELAVIQSASLDTRISFPNYGSIQAKGTFSGINYNGANNTPVSFVMLDALQKGSNWLWNISWERRLGKGIELSLEYEGRAPGNNPVVHTGRMSIRAIL